MHKSFNLLSLLGVFALAVGAVLTGGCEGPTTAKNSADESAADHDDHDHDHDHAHAHTAPNGGFLIDIGRDHKYHAELVDNHDTNVVSIFMFDGELKPLAVAPPTISLTLTAGDKSGTFEFTGESESSSEFTLKDESMMALLDTDGVKGKIRITIEDKPFTGSFDYKHDHDHSH